MIILKQIKIYIWHDKNIIIYFYIKNFIKIEKKKIYKYYGKTKIIVKLCEHYSYETKLFVLLFFEILLITWFYPQLTIKIE